MLCGRDVENFCRTIMGDTALILRPSLNPTTRHTLAFTTNFHENNVVPEYLTRAEIHSQVLQPFRKHLRGFSSVSLQGSCVGLDGALATAAVQDMKSGFTLEPEKILSDIEELVSWSRLWYEKNSYWHIMLPILKATDWCKRAVSDAKVWARIQVKASDRRAFVEKMLLEAYNLVTLQVQMLFKFVHDMDPDQDDCYTALTMQAYEMSLAVARWFGAPDWRPRIQKEIIMNYFTAKVLLANQNTPFTGQPLAIGYKAAHRVLELLQQARDYKVDKKKLEKLVEVYEKAKETSVGLGSFNEIDDDSVLIENGITRWSGSQPLPADM